MIVVSHRIAGITFRTESNAWLPRLQEEPYERFRVGDDSTPDVLHRIHKVDADSLTLAPPTGEERERLLRSARSASGAQDSPLLRSPVVRVRLRADLDQPELVRAWLYDDRVLIYDFSDNVFDFFYTEAYGEYRGPLAPLRNGYDMAPDVRSLFHRVGSDALTSDPLTEEERGRIPAEVCYTPMALNSPILRAPLVRVQLCMALERPAQMEARLYWNGLMVHDLSRDALDFYYMDDVGERDVEPGLCTPEGRVAANFRQMFSAFLPRFSAFLMHSAGVIRDDRAALFLAPDEGGKTTVLSHSTEGLFLNDDQIIVRKEGDDIIAHGTPLGLMTSGPCQARLGALFVLDKATRFELAPVKPANLVQSLWREHRSYTSLLPQHLKIRAFELFCDVCTRVPIYRMSFPKDYVDWDAIDAAMVR